MMNYMTIDEEMARQKRYEELCKELKRPDLPSGRIESIYQEIRSSTFAPFRPKEAHELIAINPNTPPEILRDYLIGTPSESTTSGIKDCFSSILKSHNDVFKNPALLLILFEKPELFFSYPDTSLHHIWVERCLKILQDTNIPPYFAQFWESHPIPSIRESASLHLSHATLNEETWLQDLVNQLFSPDITPEEALEIVTLGFAPPAWEPQLRRTASEYRMPYTSWEEAVAGVSKENRKFCTPERIQREGFAHKDVTFAYLFHPKVKRSMLLYIVKERHRKMRCIAYTSLKTLSKKEKGRIRTFIFSHIKEHFILPSITFENNYLAEFLYNSKIKSIFDSLWLRTYFIYVIQYQMDSLEKKRYESPQNQEAKRLKSLLTYIALIIFMIFADVILLVILPFEMCYRIFIWFKNRPVANFINFGMTSPKWRVRLAMAFRPDLPQQMRETLKNDANIYVRKVAQMVEKDSKLIEKLFALTPQVAEKY
jgi:hypothetical protein